MKKIKNISLILLATILLCVSLSACSSSSSSVTKNAKPGKFAIIAYDGSTAQANEIKSSIIDKLVEAEYASENIDFKDSQGSEKNLKDNCSSVAAGDYIAVFTIGTLSTKQYLSLDAKAPCFYSCVESYDEEFVKELKSNKNATGIIDDISVEDVIDMGIKVTPTVTKWGIIYCENENESKQIVERAEKYFDALNTNYEIVKIKDANDAKSKTQKLLDKKCNAIFLPNDIIVERGASSISKLCNDKGVPTYSMSSGAVNSGCLASVSFNNAEVGERIAKMCIKHLNGLTISQIPSYQQRNNVITYNNKSSKAIKEEKEKFDVIPPSPYTFEEELVYID